VSHCASRSPARIRFAGQRLPYHQNAQTRRARGDRGKCRTNSSLRESYHARLAQSPGTSGRICKAEKSKTRDTSDTYFVAVDAVWCEPVSPCKLGKAG